MQVAKWIKAIGLLYMGPANLLSMYTTKLYGGLSIKAQAVDCQQHITF